jgi:NhaA family Na+:H+ antiporter
MKTSTAVHHMGAPVVASAWRTHFVFEYLLALPIGAAVGLFWANAYPESYFRFSFSASFFVNEIAMAFFFGLMTKEIVEATAPGGLFHPWRRLILPVALTIGGALGAAVLYFVLIRVLDAPRLASAWPVVFATDLAFGYFLARMIFGRHPALTFVLLMAIVSNGLGFGVLAATHPFREIQPTSGALLMTLAIAFAATLRMAGTRSFWPYVIVGGTLSWFALSMSGFHPAFALVPILPFLPHAARDRGFFVDAPASARNALDRFEIWCRVPAQIALLLFGLVNAGVPLQAVERGHWAAPLAMLAGKPLGVLAVTGLIAMAGVPLPARIGWRELLVIGLISGVGFTLALFFAGVIFPAGQLLSETRAGALLTVAGGGLAFASAALHRVGRFRR